MSASTSQLRNVATGKAENPVASFSKFMDSFKSQLALALPKHLTADRMARLAVTAFSTTPALQACEPRSIAAAVMTASVLGLEIGVDGQCFLVPYDRICTLVPGWKGLVDLVSRSGRATVWTGAAFEGDEFDYALGDRPFVKHKPDIEDDPAKITHVYAIGRVNGSDYPTIAVWRIQKVWNHRDKYNKVGKKHYSFRYQEMYARKLPLLQVLKYMPKSIELSNAIEATYAAERGASATIEGNFVTIAEPPDEQGDQQADFPAPTYAEILDRINKSTDADVLDLAADSIADVPDAAQRAELVRAAEAKFADLTKGTT